jgi:hypothetical protein
VHNVDVVWHICSEIDCTSKFKTLSDLKRHNADVHDIGIHQCECCIKKCNTLTEFTDTVTNKTTKNCRKCYHKLTGYKTKIEKEIVEWLNINFEHPAVSVDKRVNGDACLKYRPDIMYTCGNKKLVIYIEIDEHQHTRSNGDYTCDEKRMSELYDETPGCLVVFIRFNPHSYKTTDGNKIIKLKETRHQLLLDVLKYVCKNEEALANKNYMHIFYICYSPDNDLLSKNIPHTLVYSKNDLE